MSDIESNTTTNFVNMPNGEAVAINVREVRIGNHHNNGFSFKENLVVATIMIALCSPLIVCDFYYALTDKSCVNQSFDQLDVNMYVYLMVNAIIGVIMTAVYSYIILFVNIEYTIGENEVSFMMYISFHNLMKLFITSWSVVGAVIFWKYMDTTQCNNSVYNYLGARIIIQLVAVGMGIVSSKK